MAFSYSSSVSNCSTYCAVLTAKAASRQVLLSLHYFYFSKINCTAAFYIFLGIGKLVFDCITCLRLSLSAAICSPQSNLSDITSQPWKYVNRIPWAISDQFSNVKRGGWLLQRIIKVDTSFGSKIPQNYSSCSCHAQIQHKLNCVVYRITYDFWFSCWKHFSQMILPSFRLLAEFFQ